MKEGPRTRTRAPKSEVEYREHAQSVLIPTDVQRVRRTPKVDDAISLKTAARICRMSLSTVWLGVKRGELEVRRPGWSYITTRAWLQEWLDQYYPPKPTEEVSEHMRKHGAARNTPKKLTIIHEVSSRALNHPHEQEEMS